MTLELQGIFDGCKLVYLKTIDNIKEMVKALPSIKRNTLHFDENNLCTTFDIVLQYSLLQVALSDNELDINEIIFISKITKNGDLLKYLKVRTGVSMTWKGLFKCDVKMLHAFINMIEAEMLQMGNEFIKTFSICDKYTKYDYLSDLTSQVLMIIKALSFMDGDPDSEDYSKKILIIDCLNKIKAKKKSL